MTIMGMAASQARFLGLTARKSNVEYQGQQVNQQRTALANESAGLYEQMMALDVPTPPISEHFNKVVCTLEGSKNGKTSGDYELLDYKKSYDGDNKYQVTLGYKESVLLSNSYNYSFVGKAELDKDKDVYRITLNRAGNQMELEYDYNDANRFYKTDGEGDDFAFTDIEAYKICGLPVKDEKTGEIDQKKASKLFGYTKAQEDFGTEADPIAFFFQDEAGKTYFLTQSQVDFDNIGDGQDYPLIFGQESFKTQQTTALTATMEKSSSGRVSSIKIDDPACPSELKGTRFNITYTTEFDERGYDDAMNEYEFQKSQYEKSIQDINSQTKEIQNQDQRLELKLKQLDTEQQAIATELDAVTKVIDDNVDKTFKVFA